MSNKPQAYARGEEVDGILVLAETEAKKKFTISKDSPLHFLDITRSYKRDREFSKKTRLFGKDGFKEDGFKLTPEIDVYHFVAGYNAGSFGALQMLVNSDVDKYTDHLGLVEAMSVIIPIAILSEMFNKFLYQKSFLDSTNVAEAANLFKDNVKEKAYADALSGLAFTALWGIYQAIRVPVIALAFLTAMVLWIPKMVAGFLASTLTFVTRPLWYFPASAVDKQLEKAKDKKEAKEEKDETDLLGGKGHDGEDRVVSDEEAKQPKPKAKSKAKTQLRDETDDQSRSEDPKAKKGERDLNLKDSFVADGEVDNSFSA